jgi:leucyl-tRNA synthetase
MTEIDQKQIEKKWQKKWKESKAFQPKIDPSKEKFFGTVPYPYANSVLHIGHGRGYTTPDIYIRFQRLLGKNVLFPLGFHISGTPVLAVADGIKRGDSKQIKLTENAIREYVSDDKEVQRLLKLFEDPMEIAKFFSNTIEGSLDSIGISIDWSRQFSTGDDLYQKFIEWQFKKLHDLGILVQGKYPILYSPQDGNAVGEDDIKDGDTDKVSVQEMTYILFKLSDEDAYIAIATLRPDALFGTTNMWINKRGNYVRVRVRDASGVEKVWVVDKAAVVKLEHQFENVEVISEHLGEEFLHKTVITPIVNREVQIFNADFLDPNHGTGIAYSSPAGSPHDFMGLLDGKREGRVPEDIVPIVTVDTKDKKGNVIEYNGSCPAEDKCKKFGITSSTDPKLEEAKQELYKEEHYGGVLNSNAGSFQGIPIKKAKELLVEELKQQHLGGVLYETSRRAVTRSGDIVIVACLDGQWFLDYRSDEVKQKALDLLESMDFKPLKLKETQKGYINWVEMRPCARKRGIGTPLPYDKDWVIESLSDSTIYQMLYLVMGEMKRANLEASQLSVEVFDFIMLGLGNVKNVSENSGIAIDVLKHMREQVEYWKAFDFRYTAGAHMSNHLSFLIYHYALIFEKEYHPKNITIGGMLIKDGHKISKSKGNGIPLVQVPKRYGADLYRLYVGLAANYDVEMDFRDEDISQLSKKFDKWKELISTSLSLNLPEYSSLSDTNKWLISRFYSRVTEYFNHFKDMRIREAYVAVFYEFMNEIVYHERRTSYDETLKVLRFIVEDYLKIMAPIIPHICEEFWEKLGKEEFISLAVFDTDCDNYINKTIEDIEMIVSEIISSVGRIKETKNLTSISTITLVQASEQRFKLFDTLKQLLVETKDFKQIMGTLMKDFSQDKKFIQKFVPKTLGSSGLSEYLSREEERKLLGDISEFLQKEFGGKVIITTAEEQQLFTPSIIPGRVGVIVE